MLNSPPCPPPSRNPRRPTTLFPRRPPWAPARLVPRARSPQQRGLPLQQIAHLAMLAPRAPKRGGLHTRATCAALGGALRRAAAQRVLTAPKEHTALAPTTPPKLSCSLCARPAARAPIRRAWPQTAPRSACPALQRRARRAGRALRPPPGSRVPWALIASAAPRPRSVAPRGGGETPPAAATSRTARNALQAPPAPPAPPTAVPPAPPAPRAAFRSRARHPAPTAPLVDTAPPPPPRPLQPACRVLRAPFSPPRAPPARSRARPALLAPTLLPRPQRCPPRAYHAPRPRATPARPRAPPT